MHIGFSFQNIWLMKLSKGLHAFADSCKSNFLSCNFRACVEGGKIVTAYSQYNLKSLNKNLPVQRRLKIALYFAGRRFVKIKLGLSFVNTLA